MEQDKIKKLLFDRDESALGHIQTEYGHLMKSIAFNLFRNDGVADECLNDTLLDVWNTIPPKDPKSLISYVCMLVRRRAIDRFRQEIAQRRAHPEAAGYAEVSEELAFMEDFADDVVERLEITRILNEHMRSLSGTNREIFISRYYDFESLDSISARLHISKNSVNIRLTRMRQALKEKLEKGDISL